MIDTIYILTLLFSGALSLFIFWCYLSWIRIPFFNMTNKTSGISVSIVIAARNEENNIIACLNQIHKQDYPLSMFELIVVDDQSSDGTFSLVTKFAEEHPKLNLRLIKMSDHTLGSKKDALSIGISQSKFKTILVTDADCLPALTWLSTMVQCYQSKDARFLAGPVILAAAPGFFGKIQSLEFMGLVGIAAAGISKSVPIMCNGANMMFSKSVFTEVGGFDSTQKLVSGDDTQLLLKVAQKYPDKIFFNKSRNAIVSAAVQNGLSDFIEQRKRWAGKIPFALTSFTIGIAAIAWLAHVFLLFSLVLAFYNQELNPYFVLSSALLVGCEFILLNSMATFFQRRDVLWLFLPVQIFYWIYIVLIGAIAPLGTFKWKDRTSR